MCVLMDLWLKPFMSIAERMGLNARNTLAKA